jgi:acetylornithine/succinyldiaminopimelate/putrescine aminotransferase
MKVSPCLEQLWSLRSAAGPASTRGLADEVVLRFAARDPRLPQAIAEAVALRAKLADSHGHLFQMPEPDLCSRLQSRILNFYPAAGINPYVPLAASGPWIVTTHGAVLHDSGGYGMLGLGHAPATVLEAMNHPLAMANVMTPSFSQFGLTERLVKEIGRARGSCPFGRFVFLNSGSEAVTFTCRVSDVHARLATDPGGRHAGKATVRLAVIDSFHGRTEGPARLSHSCRPAYVRHLASFRGNDGPMFVPVNDVAALERAFDEAAGDGVFIESVYVEPVMGEGVAGLALTREYYDAARRLTRETGSLLVVDSVQAAFRAHGCLSIVDYPEFESSAPPDMETYSKALNAGQYPLSVIALTDEAAAEYATGLYGNTMTGNPRAMEAACAVMDGITDDLRANIRERGRDFVRALEELSREHPGAIERVVGTGLMVSAMLNPARYQVLGTGGFEQYLRTHGIEMIHAGESGLRFTPAFDITREEIELIVSVVRQGVQELAPCRVATLKGCPTVEDATLKGCPTMAAAPH